MAHNQMMIGQSIRDLLSTLTISNAMRKEGGGEERAKKTTHRCACLEFMVVLPLCFDRYDNNDDGSYFY